MWQKIKCVCFVLYFSGSAFSAVNDWIHDDYSEDEKFSAHSRGLLTYGTHSNTFHLRHFFARANYNHEKLQAFLTLNGYKDTHEPSTEYGYILNNINLYDYGIDYRFYEGFHVSLRGAAPYRENFETYLLILPYYFGSPAEFDRMDGYLNVQKTGPGIRVGYRSEQFEVGYSQGDFRHSIPTAFLGKFAFSDKLYFRGVLYSEYENPAVFPSEKKWRYQLSHVGEANLLPQLTMAWIVEATSLGNREWRFRFEQAIKHFDMILAFRESFVSGRPVLFELSLKRQIAGVASFGVHYASRGYFYIGTEVNF